MLGGWRRSSPAWLARRRRPRRSQRPARSATRTWTWQAAPALRRGVAKDRRISVEDAEMRHGRKSRSVLFDGYKRHVLRDLDTGLVVAAGITPANAPEASVTGDITADLRQPAAPWPNCTSTGPTCPRSWSATAARAWRSTARPGESATRRPVCQGPVQHRLHRRATDLPRRGGHAVRARQDRPLPQRHLCCLPAAAALHRQQQRAQRIDPSRRGAAGRTAPAPADPQGRASCANASRSNTPSPTSGTGKDAAPATAAPARTSSTCAASPWSTTSTSSPASPSPTVISLPPDGYMTGALGCLERVRVRHPVGEVPVRDRAEIPSLRGVLLQPFPGLFLELQPEPFGDALLDPPHQDGRRADPGNIGGSSVANSGIP